MLSNKKKYKKKKKPLRYLNFSWQMKAKKLVLREKKVKKLKDKKAMI